MMYQNCSMKRIFGRFQNSYSQFRRGGGFCTNFEKEDSLVVTQ